MKKALLVQGEREAQVRCEPPLLRKADGKAMFFFSFFPNFL